MLEYARVVIGQYQPGKLDEGEQIYRESILPEARQQPGFKGALGLVDRNSGKAISITLWQTEANAQASGASSSYGQAQLAKSPLWLPPHLVSKHMRSLSKSKRLAQHYGTRQQKRSCLFNLNTRGLLRFVHMHIRARNQHTERSFYYVNRRQQGKRTSFH